MRPPEGCKIMEHIASFETIAKEVAPQVAGL
jgi:hypothetical protein